MLLGARGLKEPMKDELRGATGATGTAGEGRSTPKPASNRTPVSNSSCDPVFKTPCENTPTSPPNNFVVLKPPSIVDKPGKFHPKVNVPADSKVKGKWDNLGNKGRVGRKVRGINQTRDQLTVDKPHMSRWRDQKTQVSQGLKRGPLT